MKIQTKLILLVVIVSISFIVVAGMYLSTLSEMSELNRGLRNGHAMIAKVWKVQSATQDLMLTDSLSVAYDAWHRATAELAEYHDRFLANEALAEWADRQGSADQYQNAISFFETVNTQIDEFAAGYDEVAGELGETSGGLFREVHLNRNMRYLFLNNRATSLIAYLGDTTEKVVVRLVDLLEETYRQLQERITIVSIAITIAIVSAISAFILFFTRSIRRSFRGIEATMHELACGDFTKHLEVRGRDELASLSGNINSFIDQFSEIIRKIKDTSDRTVELRDELSASTDDSSRAVADIAESINSIASEVEDLKSTLEESGSAVRDISSSIDLLAQQIENQSSAVAESSSSIEEMAASIKNVARVADSKQEATDKLVAVTKSGGEKVSATDSIVEDITERVNSMMEIIGIINKIASQTNMLSMNAAIEAAHAGDAGRGFSVVAEEIRNLSESTNLNAKKIRETLQEIRNRADEAQALSKESSSFFDQIFTEVDGVTQALREIASTMDELSVGSNEILSSTSELTKTTTIIKETSGSIQERTTRIDASMQNVRSFAEQLSGRISAVDVATGGIRTAIGHVAEISARNSENISELSAEVNQFVVDGCVDDSASNEDAGNAATQVAGDAPLDATEDDELRPAAMADEASAGEASDDDERDDEPADSPRPADSQSGQRVGGVAR